MVCCNAQEHLVASLMAQQDSIRTTQLLIGLNTFAVLLLVAFGSSWTATAAAGCMMFVLLYVLSPGAVRQATHGPPGLLNDSVPKVQGIAQPLRQLSRSLGGTTVEVRQMQASAADRHTDRACLGHDCVSSALQCSRLAEELTFVWTGGATHSRETRQCQRCHSDAETGAAACLVLDLAVQLPLPPC